MGISAGVGVGLTVTAIGESGQPHDESVTVIDAVPTPVAVMSARGDGGGHAGGRVGNTGSGEGLAGFTVTISGVLTANVTVSPEIGVAPGAGEFAV